MADLSAAGVRLRPDEAATLVRELALQVERGEVAGVPSAHVVRLSASGAISVEGPVAAGGRSVERAAQLLEALLTPAAGDGQQRVPGGLKLVLARGLGTLDLPPFASFSAFTEAVGRFGGSDPADMVTSLVVRWTEAVASRPEEECRAVLPAQAAHGAQIERFAPADHPAARAALPVLTISDIRRARRATGLTLPQVSERSGIPVGLLRQLEWGYLLNWPTGPQSRMHSIKYARAAGLDEQLVAATVMPLQEQAVSLRQLLASRPAGSEADGSALPVTGAWAAETAAERERADRERDDARATRRSRALALLAIPAFLALALIPAWWLLDPYAAVQPAAPPALVQGIDEQNGETRAGGLVPHVPPDATDVAERLPAPRPEPAGGAAAQPSPSWTASAGKPVLEGPAMVPAAAVTGPSRGPFPVSTGGGSPVPASVGTAMFYEPDDDASGSGGASGAGGAAHLLITRIVDDPANNFHVRRSPDGRRIAFDSDRDGERAVYVTDDGGKNVRRVSPVGAAAMPSWAPDGRTLAFTRAEPDDDVWNLWTLDLDSGVLRRVTELEQGHPSGGSWFPDGDLLAYTLGERLVIRDLRAGKEQVFRSPRKGRVLQTPTVSPDGRIIAFRVAGEGTWLLDVPDGAMRRVLEDPTADEYAWSRDGRQLAYYSAEAGVWGVWKMAPR